MFGKILIGSLVALTAIALAQPDVKFKNHGFTYYSEYDAEEITDEGLERTAFVRLWLDNSGITVVLSDDPFEGAIEQTFTEIPALDGEAEREIWGQRRAGESFIAQRRLQESESERVHQLVGLDEHGLGWAITHSGAELPDVVDAYLGWLSEEGVAVEELGNGGNAASYQLSAGDLSLRVVFASIGDDVRVYFQ